MELIRTKQILQHCEYCGSLLTSNCDIYDRLKSDNESINTNFNQGYYDRFFVELQKLGRGQKGSVFLVRHVLDRVELGLFAVKAMPVGFDNEYLAKMLHEVTLIQGLKHPNIVEYKHAWLETRQLTVFGPKVPCLFMLMEFSNGGCLENFILIPEHLDTKEMRKRHREHQTLHQDRDEEGVLNYGGVCFYNGTNTRFLTKYQIASFLKDICNGLRHLHDHDIIHRDLKPSNLLLKYDNEWLLGTPTVLISDFGESQLMQDNKVRTGCTGTLEYMSPELLVKDEFGQYLPNHDLKSDIWSLGCVLHFLCYSRLFYTQIDDIDLLKMEILEFHNQKLYLKHYSRIDGIFIDLIKMMLVRTASDRPTTGEILEILKTVHIDQQESLSLTRYTVENKKVAYFGKAEDEMPVLTEIDDQSESESLVRSRNIIPSEVRSRRQSTVSSTIKAIEYQPTEYSENETTETNLNSFQNHAEPVYQAPMSKLLVPILLLLSGLVPTWSCGGLLDPSFQTGMILGSITVYFSLERFGVTSVIFVAVSIVYVCTLLISSFNQLSCIKYIK
jgi:serine/threonine protein kinase